MKTLSIEMGAMSDSITDQLEAQGLESVGKSADLLERLSHAITLTHIHGVITDSECAKARKRLMSKIKVRTKS